MKIFYFGLEMKKLYLDLFLLVWFLFAYLWQIWACDTIVLVTGDACKSTESSSECTVDDGEIASLFCWDSVAGDWVEILACPPWWWVFFGLGLGFAFATLPDEFLWLPLPLLFGLGWTSTE